MIEIKHLSKAWNPLKPKLKDVNAIINDGDVIGVVGPSGCGKSTLLRLINRLAEPTAGEIIYNNENILAKNYDINVARRKIGMVFQHFNLFNNMTVIQNIMYPQMDLLKKSKQEAYDKANELLMRVGLAHKALSYPNELSGGQKQRVAICRTLAMNPDVILFDEPTSALDPSMVDEVKAFISDLAKEGHTMMVVTHDMEFVKEIANRIFYIDEGIVYEEGTVDDIFNHPKKEKTKIFVEQLKQLILEFDSGDFDFITNINKINEYCNRYRLTYTNNVNVVFEELCKQILSPSLKEKRMKVILEYSAKTKQMIMDVLYDGKEINPKDSDDTIAYRLFRSKIKNYSSEIINEDYNNRIHIEF